MTLSRCTTSSRLVAGAPEAYQVLISQDIANLTYKFIVGKGSSNSNMVHVHDYIPAPILVMLNDNLFYVCTSLLCMYV